MVKNKEVINRIQNEIDKLNNKDFTLFFFTIDSKNVPTGSLVYTYEMALALKKLGYKVKMLYQIDNEYSEREIKKRQSKGTYNKMDEQIFCGVSEWMGTEYGELEHVNISKEGAWSVAPSDFLFIPEVFSSLMSQTFIHKIPCQRYVLLQNFDYVTDFIPFGTQWINFGIRDCVATTELQANLIKDVMPYVRTTVINPYIPEYFRKPIQPKNLIVNIISKKQSDVNKLMKTFYWKYPMYKFISFKDLRGMNREHYAEQLKEGAITIWIDENTSFGYGALEAMRCGNIVIGKFPENVQEWMVDEDGELLDNVIWFDNMTQLPEVLSKVIGSWMQDEIPSELIESMERTNQLYKKSEYDKNISDFINDIVTKRIQELTIFKNNAVNNEEKVEGEQE
jgi:hypothetical protein